jgi:hypothetical protein
MTDQPEKREQREQPPAAPDERTTMTQQPDEHITNERGATT